MITDDGYRGNSVWGKLCPVSHLTNRRERREALRKTIVSGTIGLRTVVPYKQPVFNTENKSKRETFTLLQDSIAPLGARCGE